MDQTDLVIVIEWTVVWLSLLAWVWIIPAEGFQRLSALRGAPWVVVLGVRVVPAVVTAIILLVVGWPPVPPFATLWVLPPEDFVPTLQAAARLTSRSFTFLAESAGIWRSSWCVAVALVARSTC